MAFRDPGRSTELTLQRLNLLIVISSRPFKIPVAEGFPTDLEGVTTTNPKEVTSGRSWWLALLPKRHWAKIAVDPQLLVFIVSHLRFQHGFQ